LVFDFLEKRKVPPKLTFEEYFLKLKIDRKLA